MDWNLLENYTNLRVTNYLFIVVGVVITKIFPKLVFGQYCENDSPLPNKNSGGSGIKTLLSREPYLFFSSSV